MKKHLAEAVRNIIESVITMKKEYSENFPCYVMERMYEKETEEDDDEWKMEVTCVFTDDMLTIVLLLERMGTMHIEINNNYSMTIS